LGRQCRESGIGRDFLGQRVSSWEDNERESDVTTRSFRSRERNRGTPGSAEALSSTLNVLEGREIWELTGLRIGGAKFSDEFIDQLLCVGRAAAMGGGEEDPKTSPFDRGETLETEGVPQ